MTTDNDDELAALAGGRRPGFVSELLAFVIESRKWWLMPIMIAVVLFGVLVFLASTGAAPFIYTLF